MCVDASAIACGTSLSRKVAIKVPHCNLVDRLEDAEAYLREARTVANLDYPHIVPVFDVGGTAHFPVLSWAASGLSICWA